MPRSTRSTRRSSVNEQPVKPPLAEANATVEPPIQEMSLKQLRAKFAEVFKKESSSSNMYYLKRKLLEASGEAAELPNLPKPKYRKIPKVEVQVLTFSESMTVLLPTETTVLGLKQLIAKVRTRWSMQKDKLMTKTEHGALSSSLQTCGIHVDHMILKANNRTILDDHTQTIEEAGLSQDDLIHVLIKNLDTHTSETLLFSLGVRLPLLCPVAAQVPGV
mmetsp:Transcript_2842/g.10320  ORF Transcript_2842/g.10320 Transcript_2842/m.10320 type:complete len:219 (-) Transcript_2842:1801-2457(-)